LEGIGAIGNGNNAEESSGLVAGVAGTLAALAAIAAVFVLFFIRRRNRPDELVGESGDEMDQSEGVDATTFSSDEAFVSEYGFSDHGANSGEGEGNSGGGSDEDEDEILVSEYGVSDNHQGSRGSEGAMEDLEESLDDDENDADSAPDDDSGE
jgi:hypothetical protein